MLQNIEAGRDPEIDALVGSVVELGRLTQPPGRQQGCCRLLTSTVPVDA
jgi:hypothetical protein